MIEQDRGEFAQGMAELFSVYAVTVTPDLLTAFWRALEEYHIKAVLAAFSQHQRDHSGYGYRAPTPADILKQLEVTMPEIAQQHCNRVIQAAQSEIDPLIERRGLYEAMARLKQISVEESQQRIADVDAQISAITRRPEVQAARRGVSFKDPAVHRVLPRGIETAIVSSAIANIGRMPLPAKAKQ